MSASLLVELFTEELPPKALQRLGSAFGHGIVGSLASMQLTAADPQSIRIFATPRRLAVLIPGVAATGAARTESKKLMPSKVAYGADGKPSAALAKRLEKENATASQLQRKTEGGAEFVFLNQTIAGVTLAAGLQAALDDTLAKLPIPKSMSYQLADGTTTVHFVRPAHGLVALHGAEIIAVSVLGLTAGRITHGHRFQGVKDISIATADAYPEALAAHGNVIASFEERRASIARQLLVQARALNASLGVDADYAPLLEEVTALVEYPTVYTGEFDAEFLAVPPECLVLTMRQNQKYFPLFDAAGKLINKFLIVSNMRLADPKNIVDGNQRVVRPRLADARFFFDEDKKTPLEKRVPLLARVVYHNQLGSQLERTERVQNLAGNIASALGADARLARRAAWLAKADLLTNMVGEFPELQGIMGRYYALADGENPGVADAIEQHYRPRYAGDALPLDQTGIVIALADKLETLVGLFSIGQLPTGDKDPFALRRHALGVLRMLIDGNLDVSLVDLIRYAEQPFKGLAEARYQALVEFIFERLANMLREQGYSAHEVDAVLSPLLAQHVAARDMAPPLREVPRRLTAVRAFSALPESAALAAANKRIGNILRKAVAGALAVDPSLLIEPAEQALAQAIARVRPDAQACFAAGDYAATLKVLAQARDAVDAFFGEVMVMAEDARLRDNRIALLRELHGLMNLVADISKLAT